MRAAVQSTLGRRIVPYGPLALASTIGLLASVAVAHAVDGGTPPRFTAGVSAVTRSALPYSYRAGCPVPPPELRLVRLRYWGFDRQAHVGALVVNRAVVSAVIEVFSRLYAERFPIRRMEPIDVYQGNDEASMAADNTSGFNCRYAVATGPPRWSAHAYGEAIDVNPVENPYTGCGATNDRASVPYLNRSVLRPGMVTPAVVAAFASVGWGWGGSWTGATQDYMHFSVNGH